MTKYRLSWSGHSFYSGSFNTSRDFDSLKEAESFIKKDLIKNGDVDMIHEIIKFTPAKQVRMSRDCMIGKHDFERNEGRSGRGCDERRSCSCKCHEAAIFSEKL
jgi:hypothetical protein